uniref:Uncharacterized protein n=1 Tax=Myotis myotis TaxID=51298 RepID=A0A7J8AMA8_MYOMY|nr:hypothetical protein mMyoMyo1_008055 [Myotis myotis]
MVFHHFFLCSSLLMPIHSPSTCPLPTFLSCHPNPSSFFFPCSYLLHLFSLLLCLPLLPSTTSTSPFYLSFFPLPSPSWPLCPTPTPPRILTVFSFRSQICFPGRWPLSLFPSTLRPVSCPLLPLPHCCASLKAELDKHK